MVAYTLDLDGVSSADELEDRFIQHLNFPGYYGRNGDAFWDCLRAFDKDDVIVVKGLRNPSQDVAAKIAFYVDILSEGAEEFGFELGFVGAPPQRSDL